MKRFLSYLLITVMMLGVLAGCETTPKQVEEHTFPDAEYAVNATDMAVVRDKIYYISDEKVYETALDTVVFEEFPVSRIAAAGDTFAVFGGGQVKIGEDSYTLPVTEITSLVCVGNTIGYTYKENDLEMLGFVNRKNGDSISIPPLENGQVRMLPYKDKSVLVHCINTESGYVLLYDFDTETMKPGSVLIDTMNIDLPAYSKNDNAIYWLDGNAGGAHLTRYDVETATTTTLIPADALRMSILDLTFSGGSAIVRKLSGGISVVNEVTSTEEGMTTVKVLALNKGLAEQVERLSYILKRDYNIQLEVTTIAEDKLRLKLLSEESDFDLYTAAMQDGGTYLTNTLVLDYPIYEPLENFPQIVEQMDGLFDDVVRLCSHGEHIFGIPASFHVNTQFMSYDADFLKELGLSLPDAGWSLFDYYELAKKVRSDGVYISGFFPLSLWDYMWQYFDPYGSGTLNDDGKALREYLTIYKRMQQEDLIYPGLASEMRKAIEQGELRVLFGTRAGDFVWDKSNVLFYPTFTGERIYTANVPYLMMNPQSKNKNAAATVLAEYLNPENRILCAVYDSYIYEDMSVYYHPMVYTSNFEEYWDSSDEENRAVLLERIEKDYKTYMTNNLVNMDEKTAENFALYLDYLKYAKLGPSYVDEWLRFAADEAEKYWNDQQDLDYTVTRIIDRAKLILDE